MILPRRTVVGGHGGGDRRSRACPSADVRIVRGRCGGASRSMRRRRCPPAEALRRLAGIDARRCAAASPARSVATARAGLTIDRAPLGRRRCRRDLRRCSCAARSATIDARRGRRAARRRARRPARARRGAVRRDRPVARAASATRYVALFADPRYLYPDSDAGRAAAVADMNAHARAPLRARDDRAFADAPACVPRRRGPPPAAPPRSPRASAAIAIPAPGRPGAYVVDLQGSRAPPALDAAQRRRARIVARPPGPARRSRRRRRRTRCASTMPPPSSRAGRSMPRRSPPTGVVHAIRATELGHLHWLSFARRAGSRRPRHPPRRLDARPGARAASPTWQGEPVYFAPFDTDLARIVDEPGTRAAEALAWLAIADRAPPRRPRRRCARSTRVRCATVAAAIDWSTAMTLTRRDTLDAAGAAAALLPAAARPPRHAGARGFDGQRIADLGDGTLPQPADRGRPARSGDPEGRRRTIT